MPRVAAAVLVVATIAAGAGAQTLAPLQQEPSGRVTYFVAQGEPGTGFRKTDAELATWALKAWEKSIGGALRFEAAAENDALVRVNWVAPGGQYGEMRPLLVRGRRGAVVYVQPDTDALGGEMARLAQADPLLRETIVYLTCLHELGHALGLEHTAQHADIMYFFGYGGDIPAFFARYRAQLKSRADIPNVSGLSGDDVKRVRGLYEKP
jgi:hypothetical protein